MPFCESIFITHSFLSISNVHGRLRFLTFNDSTEREPNQVTQNRLSLQIPFIVFTTIISSLYKSQTLFSTSNWVFCFSFTQSPSFVLGFVVLEKNVRRAIVGSRQFSVSLSLKDPYLNRIRFSLPYIFGIVVKDSILE
jgi:hypothetical protein